MKGNLVKGLTEQSKIEGGSAYKLRGETSEKTQRPVSKTETVKGDGGRGSFKVKC